MGLFSRFLFFFPFTVYAASDCLANQYSPLERPSLSAIGHPIKNISELTNWKETIHFSRASIAWQPLVKRAPIGGPSSLVAVDLDDRAWQYDPLSTQWSEGGCGVHQKTTEERTANDVYNFKFWQYADVVYYFGHSMVTIPPTMWTNAAHKNGVLSLGTFNIEYSATDDIPNIKEITDALYDMATQLHFDGYLINPEVYYSIFDPAPEKRAQLSSALINMMSTLRAKGLTIIWYDSTLSATQPGKSSYDR